MNYRVENNQVIFTDGQSRRNAKRGRKLGSRISELVVVSGINLTGIARIYTANRYPNNSEVHFRIVRVTKICLSQVLSNRDNSPAYIQAIESAWRLPIATIREYYQLDKTNPLTWQEQLAFKNDYALKCFSQKPEEQAPLFRKEGMGEIFRGVAA